MTTDDFDRLPAEAYKLFGVRHYRSYRFLLTMSDRVAHFGLEHHECSDDRGPERLLLDDRFRGKLPLFGGIDRARFRRQVVPGDSLDLEIRLGRLSARARAQPARGSVGRRPLPDRRVDPADGVRRELSRH